MDQEQLWQPFDPASEFDDGTFYSAEDDEDRVYLDKLRKIIEPFIDENDAKFHVEPGNRRRYLRMNHPVVQGETWAKRDWYDSLYYDSLYGNEDLINMHWFVDYKTGFDMIIKALDDPEKRGTVQAIVKAKIKEDLSVCTLTELLDSLREPYLFRFLKEARGVMAAEDYYYAFRWLSESDRLCLLKEAKEDMTTEDYYSAFWRLSKSNQLCLLKEAKEIMTTEDFTVAMSHACKSGFNEEDSLLNYNEIGNELLELFKACDPKVFREQGIGSDLDPEEEITVYISETDDPSLELCWCSSRERYLSSFYYTPDDLDEVLESAYDWKACTAKIKVKDIFCWLDLVDYDVILNPDKLYDIEHNHDVTQWKEYHDLVNDLEERLEQEQEPEQEPEPFAFKVDISEEEHERFYEREYRDWLIRTMEGEEDEDDEDWFGYF